MTTIQNASDDELQAELDRRKAARALERPRPLVLVDWSHVQKLAEDYAAFIDDDERYCEDNRFENYVFEAVLSAVFGDAVFWAWHRRRRP